MAVDIMILVFWDVTSCSLLGFLVHTLVPIYPTRQQLLDDLKKKRRHWNFIEEALDRSPCRTHCGKGYSPVAKQTTQ
jgi:hypothetical protein